MEITDPEDAEKFQSTNNMISKLLVKCLELVGAVEGANGEVIVVMMVRLMDDTRLSSFVLFFSLFRLKSHAFVIVK
jgi:hypothetical protein